MDNNLDNTPENKDVAESQETVSTEPKQPVYTDPNAGVDAEQSTESQPQQPEQNQGQDTNNSQPQYGYCQQPEQNNSYNNYQQQYQNQGQEQQYSQYQQYQNTSQDNYNYNVGNNAGYHNRTYDTGMDQSPMSMGDWVLTILALCIPCAGIVLYFVWAFGKTGNINRRNYCRAALIITGILFVIYIIFIIIFGLAAFSSISYY